MVNVLVTTAFDEARLDRLRRISPDLTVTRAEADTADYSRAEILYAGALPHDPGRAPGLKWVQVHMAGVNGLYEHPIYANRAIALTTASGVHAATVAEYAITALLALAHRVPRMVEWHGRGTWPPDEQRWPLFVPTAVRGATLGVIGYGSIGRELARIAKTAFAMRVLACKRDPSRRADPGYCPTGTGDPEGALPAAWVSPAQLPDLLTVSDVVGLWAPVTRVTHQMIGARERGAIEKTASSRDPDSNKRAAASTSRSGLARSASASKLYRGTGHGRIRGQQTLLDRWVLPPGGWSPAEAQQDEDAATNESETDSRV